MLAMLMAAAVSSAEAPADRSPCYDSAFVGRITRAGRIVSTSDDLSHRTTYHGLIQRDAKLIGAVPKLSWMSVTMRGVPLRTSKFLLLVKERPGDVPKVVRLEGIAAASSRSDWLRSVEATGLRRCIG
jgi:hypothetical protein